LGSASPTDLGAVRLPCKRHQLYAIELDYFQAGGGAVRATWLEQPIDGANIIPQSQLYPITTLPPVFFSAPGYFSNGNFQLQAQGMAGAAISSRNTDFVHWTSLEQISPQTTSSI